MYEVVDEIVGVFVHVQVNLPRIKLSKYHLYNNKINPIYGLTKINPNPQTKTPANLPQPRPNITIIALTNNLNLTKIKTQIKFP